ncbi:MAG: GntR family transcriptional regulator [Pirellulaceae bacterium]
MFFQIDSRNGVPVYEQVARQVTFAVANGALQSGELVPSVRQLARELAINPNTVARAYRQLQDQEILESIRGTGMVIAQGARPVCKSERTRILRERIGSVIDEALQSQLTKDEINTLFKSELGKKRGK